MPRRSGMLSVYEFGDLVCLVYIGPGELVCSVYGVPTIWYALCILALVNWYAQCTESRRSGMLSVYGPGDLICLVHKSPATKLVYLVYKHGDLVYCAYMGPSWSLMFSVCEPRRSGMLCLWAPAIWYAMYIWDPAMYMGSGDLVWLVYMGLAI